MARLLPLHLAEHELPLRVRHLLSAARVVAMTLLGPAIVRALIATHHTEPLDIPVDLVVLFAWLDPRDA